MEHAWLETAWINSALEDIQIILNGKHARGQGEKAKSVLI